MTVHSVANDKIRALPRYFRQGAEAEWAGRAQRVDVRHDLTYQAFVREYARPKRPVVVRKGVPLDALTPAVIRDVCGSRPLADLVMGGGSFVMVRGRPSAIERFNTLRTLGDYMTRFEAGDELPYLTNLCARTNFPELARVLTPPIYFRPNWRERWPLSAFGFETKGNLGEVFIGSPGASYGLLHYDRHELYLGICQFYGRKLWWLCPREEADNLYPIPGGYPHRSPVDPFKPDLERYPRFARVRPYIVTLEAGDVMFVPASWWHLTSAVTANISSLVRFVNRYNAAAHLWDFRYYCRHEPRVAMQTLRRLVTNT